MSDELLRHMATNSGEYAGMNVFDPKTLKYETVFTGQSMRLLMSMCHHANVERICFVGRETFMEETGLNGQTIETSKRRLKAAGVIKHLGNTSYKGSRPVENYLIDFPNLPPLEEVLTEKEIKKKARSLGASKTVLAIDSADVLVGVLSSASQTALMPALPVRHKQKPVTAIVNEHQQQQEWSQGCYESEPSEEEMIEFLDFRDALEDPFDLIPVSIPIKIDHQVPTNLSIDKGVLIQPVIRIPEKVFYGEPYMDALHSGDITVMKKDIERQSSHLINGNSIQKKIAQRQIANLKLAMEKISLCADTVLENV